MSSNPLSNKEPVGKVSEGQKTTAKPNSAQTTSSPTDVTGSLPENNTTAPRSTVRESRFFPGGRPTPDLIARGFNVENLASSSLEACRPRHKVKIEDLEQKNPSEGPGRSLCGTRPADSWVLDLENWRRVDARQQQEQEQEQQEQQEQQSCLSALAPEFQGYFYAAPAPAPAFPAAVRPPVPIYAGFTGFRNNSGIRRPPSPFRPMHVKSNPDGAHRPLTEEESEYRKACGISPNYQGEAFNLQNISAAIPDEENCSLFLTNLPPDCTYADLLGAVAQHRPGRVWSTYITPPDIRSDHRLPSHRTSAAKIIFFAPEEAGMLLRIVASGDFIVNGHRVTARRNRIKTPAQPRDSQSSRCLTISGPKDRVNETWLRDLFDDYFSYETEEIIVIREDGATRTLEWRFGSYRAQAGAASQLLRKPPYTDQFTVRYTRDPCAPAGY